MLRGAILSLFGAAALAAVAPAFAATQSLAERVAALEQKSAQQTQGAGQANVDLLNRLTQLQSDVQDLRNQVEQLQNENAELKQQAKDRYVDLDSRLARLEGGTPAATAPAPTASAPAPVAPAPDSAGSAPANAPAPAPVNPADEQAAYGAAFDALKRSDYVGSARGFKAYLQAFPQGALAPNAWYWLGESYYVTQNYAVALDAFNALLDQFPASGKAADALLKRGYCQIELNQVDAGRRTLGQVISRYPDSDAARLADTRLRALSLESR